MWEGQPEGRVAERQAGLVKSYKLPGRRQNEPSGFCTPIKIPHCPRTAGSKAFPAAKQHIK